MRIIAILFLLLLTAPAFSELTKEDLRTIVKEEVTASEKRMREYIDLKIDSMEKSLNARIDATNARIDALDKSLNARIDSLEKSVDARFNTVDARFDAVDNALNRMWWLMIGPYWGDNRCDCCSSNHQCLQRQRAEGDANRNPTTARKT